MIRVPSAHRAAPAAGTDRLGRLAQVLAKLPGLRELARRVAGERGTAAEAADPLEAALALCLADRWADAAEALRNLATPACASAPTWRALGVALGRVGDWRRAQSALERAVFLERDAATADLLQEVRSVRRWERACNRRPWDADARAYLGVLLFGWEHADPAFDHLRAACARGTRVAGAYTCLGVELHVRGDRAGAENAYEAALRFQPDDQSAGLFLAALRRGDPPDTAAEGLDAYRDEWGRALSG